MNFLPIWTTCFVVANLNVRYSIAFNETDTKWESVGSETRHNTTTQVLPTKILKINHELFIGGFFDLNTPHGAGELYAAMMAVKEINHDPTFLADYKIALFHKRSTEVRKYCNHVLFLIFTLFFFLRDRCGLAIQI